MAFKELTDKEKDIVLQCMIAILEGPYIEDFEFQTRLGIDRAELMDVMAAWPNVDDVGDDSAATLAMNNCMNEVLCGVPISPNDWADRFNFSMEDLEKVYIKWARLKGYSSTGIR